MNTEPYLDSPHYSRHPSGGPLSSADYEAGEESSTSSMDHQNTAGYKNNSSSLGYPHESSKSKNFALQQHRQQTPPSQLQHTFPSSAQSLSGFATPQSSPQSQGSSGRRNTNGSGSYQYSSSGSEEDHDQFSQEPALLEDFSNSNSYRVRRDSGLPPIKMTAAKRLPPFHANLSSIPMDSQIMEEEEEEEEGEEEEDQEEEDYNDQSRGRYHEVHAKGSVPHDEEYQSGHVRDRDTDARQMNNLSKSVAKGGLKQSLVDLPTHRSSFHPFPSPPTRTVPTSAASKSPTPSLTSVPPSTQPIRTQQHSSTPQTTTRPTEPDRGPADLSNPSMALAEALIAARSKAEVKSKALQQQQQPSLSTSSTNQDRSSQSHSFSYSENGRKQATPDSNGNSQIRIPVPDLSPSLRGYPTNRQQQQDLDRNPEGLLYTRRTSFTLSPTSSNPELAESQSDSHSGSYGTPRPNARSGRTSAAGKYINNGNRIVNPSISSTMSKFSDEYQQQQRNQQQLHYRESSHLGTSYDSSNSVQRLDGEMYSRFGYEDQDMDQISLSSQNYLDNHKEDYINHHHFRSSGDSDSHPYPGKQGKVSSTSFQKQRHQENEQNGRPESSAAAVPPMATNGYPATASSHSLGLSEDLQDQLTTEAEYIMNRNTELLRILSIRDDEIQTLQQELDHTLKVMHEYENDLMTMHTAAAKPYESYHQTLDQIGHEMTQQEAIVKGYQQENEKLTGQLKSSVELRQEAEKRHLKIVDCLKHEIAQLRSELDNSDQEKYGNADLRVLLKQSQESHERSRKNFKDKEEEYQAEISDLKEQLKKAEQFLEEERKIKVEDMQKLGRDIQEYRAGHGGMLAPLDSFGSNYRQNPHSKRGSSSSSADGQADTTVDMDFEREIRIVRDSLLKSPGKSSVSSNSSSPSPPLSELQQQNAARSKVFDRGLTSTDTLTTANMLEGTDGEQIDLEQRISKFEADIRQSILRTESIESFLSTRSSTGTVIPTAAQAKGQRHLNGSSRDDLRLSSMSEEHKLANKLRDRINTLNVENKRLHNELSTLSLSFRQHQAERQRRVTQLEELLDMHESMANQKLDDSNTDEGQGRIRKVIQGLLVRIRTKEAEAEFYHNAYLDKVLELDQMALTSGKHQAMESHSEENRMQNVVEGLAVVSPSGSSIEALETRIKELERINMETAFRLAAEQRRAQSAETENSTLIREKLTLARMLEDQVDQLRSKLSAAEISNAKLLDENNALRQGSKDQHRLSQSSHNTSQEGEAVNAESMANMRKRMLSLTKQRDQLREQLQEAFDIQLTMQDRSAGGVPEWSVDDYKRLERSLEEKTSELLVWKERAVALEKVVERIRMIKDKPEPTGLSLDRSSTRDSDSLSNSSAGGRHHTLEELDQVVLRLERRLERRDQELQEIVSEAKRQTDLRLEAWKAKWVQVVQRKNAEIHRFQVELESLMAAVDRDRARMAASLKK